MTAPTAPNADYGPGNPQCTARDEEGDYCHGPAGHPDGIDHANQNGTWRDLTYEERWPLLDPPNAALPGPCGASLSARCFNGEPGCPTHPQRARPVEPTDDVPPNAGSAS